MEEQVASFINAVHNWPRALESAERELARANEEAAARLSALEEWKNRSTEAAGRMESKVLWSLLALESRIAQSQEETKEVRQQLEDTPSLLWKALEELKAEAADTAARTQARFLMSLEALEARVAQSQEGAALSIKPLEEVPALLWQAMQELKAQSAEMASRTEQMMVRALEALEARAAHPAGGAADEKVLLALETLEAKVAQTGGNGVDEKVLLALETLEAKVAQTGGNGVDEKVLLALEALESRIAQTRDRSEEIASLVSAQFEQLHARSAETTARSEERVVGSLEALEARLERSQNESAEAREAMNETASVSSSESSQRLEALLKSTMDDSRLQVAQLSTLLLSRILPGLERLEGRTAELQKQTAEGRRSLGDMAALFSSSLKELTTAERNSGMATETNSAQQREMRSELIVRLQETQTTLNSRIDNLERKVDGSVRTSLSNWERFLEALELLEHKFSSILRSVEESRAVAQNATKRSDERVLKALESLEAGIGQLQPSSPAPPARVPRRTFSSTQPPDAGESPSLRASRREERLVALMLNPDEQGQPGHESA